MDNLVNSKSFCALPFIHVLFWFGTIVRPCCRLNLNIVKSGHILSLDNIDEVFKGPVFEKIRTKMLKGELIDGCEQCYSEERNGITSMRQKSNRNLAFLMNRNYKPSIKFLEIGFSNYCNLRCRMCDFPLNSYWDKNGINLVSHLYNRQRKDFKFDCSSLRDLRFVKIAMGEPTLHREFSHFLLGLIESGIDKNCEIELYTNATHFPNLEAKNSLTKFKKVRVCLSIDGYGRKNEYIRYPSKWNNIEMVTKEWFKLSLTNPNVNIMLFPTVSIYNVIYLEELIDWWIEKVKNFGLKNTKFFLNYVFKPEHFSIINLTNKLKTQLIEKINGLEKKYTNSMEDKSEIFINYNNIINNLEKIKKLLSTNDKNKIEEFLEFTKKFDKVRGESFKEIFPELYYSIKSYGR